MDNLNLFKSLALDTILSNDPSNLILEHQRVKRFASDLYDWPSSSDSASVAATTGVSPPYFEDSPIYYDNLINSSSNSNHYVDYPNVNITFPHDLLDEVNNSNISRGNDTDPLETIHFSLGFQIVIYIIYNTVFVAALLGNSLVCYIVFSSPRMRTVTNYLIANLAVGDLLMALLCVPFSYISVLLQYWPFGQVLCHIVAPAQAVCVFVSAYTLVALAADRYIAILYPLRPRLRRSQAVVVIFLVWTIAILTALPIAVYTKLIYNLDNGLPECQEIWPSHEYKLVYSLALMILQYFFPLAVLIFTYARIAIAVWGKRAPGEAEDGRDQRLAKAKRKMIKMMLTVVIVYTISWLPFNIIVVYRDLDDSIWDWELIPYAYPLIHWLALAHTVCNPIIYCWMNSRFRSGFRSAISNVPVLKKLCGIGQRNSGEYYQQEFQLHRMNTGTTYTFANHGKFSRSRNSSLLSNGRNGSPVATHNHHQHQYYLPRRSSPIINGESVRLMSSRFNPLLTTPTNTPGNCNFNGANNNNGLEGSAACHYHQNIHCTPIQSPVNSNYRGLSTSSPNMMARNSIGSENGTRITNYPSSKFSTSNGTHSPGSTSSTTSYLLNKKGFVKYKLVRQDSESFM